MAKQETRAARYGSGAVYGSLAYDFNNPNLYADLPIEEPVQAPAAPKTKQNVRTAAKAAVNRQTIAPTAILGYACAAILLVMTLMARVQLVGVSDESVALTEQLNQLELEQSRLLIEYESAFNLTEIEDYATRELGMQKPTGDQVFYVDGSSPDKAVVVDDDQSGTGIFSSLRDLLNGVVEYFR
jgi:cell division protein FtsL